MSEGCEDVEGAREGGLVGRVWRVVGGRGRGGRMFEGNEDV